MGTQSWNPLSLISVWRTLDLQLVCLLCYPRQHLHQKLGHFHRAENSGIYVKIYMNLIVKTCVILNYFCLTCQCNSNYNLHSKMFFYTCTCTTASCSDCLCLSLWSGCLCFSVWGGCLCFSVSCDWPYIIAWSGCLCLSLWSGCLCFSVSCDWPYIIAWSGCLWVFKVLPFLFECLKWMLLFDFLK